MTCVTCIIAGNGPIIEEVNDRKDVLTPHLQKQFATVYAIYEKDENSLTQGQFAFIAFCAQFLCYETTSDPIL
jgi:hypothetical protein